MTYPGGKGAVYQKIINLIPPHDIYIETHLGGGAIMQNKLPAKLNIGIDRDIEALQNFVEVSALSPLLTVEDSTVNSGDGCRPIPAKVAMWPATSPEMAGIDALLVCGDCLQWLKNHHFTGREFIYVDPPYVMDSRSSKRPIYKYKYTDQDHINLLNFLKTLDCPVMVSGYWSELYEDILSGWHVSTFEAMTRGGTLATEYLWMNYPEPDSLHDYRYLGDDYRERERIKRKKTRWVNRLKKLDRLERKAILWAIKEAGFRV